MFDFLTKNFSSILNGLTGKKTLTEKDVDQSLVQVKEALLAADVPLELVNAFCADVKKEAVGKKVIHAVKPGEQLVKIVHDQLQSFLGSKEQTPFQVAPKSVIMVLGLQGSGKTTTCAKIAHRVLKQKKIQKVLVASVDYYRPAAIDQLEVMAKKAGVSFYRAQSTNPLQAAQEIYTYFKDQKFDALLLDTAGRLHVDNQMLQELRDIDARINPNYKLLVLDAMTGQESLAVAQAFDQGVGFDAAVLTKLDSDTRGGAAFSFRYALKKPIVFAGIGEKVDDLELFYPDRMAGRMLGMGDLVSLAEKADQQIRQSEQEAMAKKMQKGHFTLEDFAQQMEMMNRLGSLGSIAKYIPGLGSQLSPEMIEKGEKELRRFKAIINSMTPKERLNHKILDQSRRNRIARGSGVEVSDINLLIARFEQSQQYVKLLKKSGRIPGLF